MSFGIMLKKNALSDVFLTSSGSVPVNDIAYLFINLGHDLETVSCQIWIDLGNCEVFLIQKHYHLSFTFAFNPGFEFDVMHIPEIIDRILEDAVDNQVPGFIDDDMREKDNISVKNAKNKRQEREDDQ